MIDTSDKVKEKLNKLPMLPGIYKFFDSYGRVIYEGKSKTLQKRFSLPKSMVTYIE